MRIVAVLLTAASAAILAGCGQKGPLYLPEKNAAVVTAPPASAAPAPAAPAPAAPAGTATPATPSSQAAPAAEVAAPSAPAPPKKQNGDDESQK